MVNEYMVEENSRFGANDVIHELIPVLLRELVHEVLREVSEVTLCREVRLPLPN